jgi:FtsP/CotA-like multicopper oxidase with cupredoxin domain
MGGGLSSAAFGTPQSTPTADAPDADITLRIQELTHELAPGRSIKTIAYNGQVPGPLLHMTEGKMVSVDVFNDTNDDEMVHWHGLFIPSDVDGSHEEGTPHVPRHGHRRYVFTPRPSGTRWYHSHVASGRNLHTGTYTGQFGMLIVEPSSDPGRYDAEVPIVLHEWDPRFSKEGTLDIEYRYLSINGRMLGAGDPIRVQRAQRVLFRILNASATETHRLALTGHSFQVLALDGNALAAPQSVRAIDIAPGERVDAIVEMNNPGVWIFGEVQDKQRAAGMGIVLEYKDQQGPPRWVPPPAIPWDYTVFGASANAPEPDGRIPLVFKQPEGSHHFTINGKSYPHTDPMIVSAGRRYRLIFDNQSADAHPVHLHRHTFEITRYDKKPTSGVFKDVVVVPAWKQVEVDFVANNPGPTLFHCHQQFHMDFGFMAMMQYSG